MTVPSQPDLAKQSDLKPIRWGVLSTSAFAENRFLPHFRRSPLVELAAVASRSLESAQAFATRNDIPVAYGSYEELLADPTITAIYNPLPNHLHAEWTRKAAEAGKHVLCEKPMVMQASELEQLRPFTDKVHIAEAFMVRHHPQWIQVRERIRNGEIGELTHAQFAFAYTNVDPTNIRNKADIGGGALYDIGCYCVVAARWFFEAEPTRALALFDRDPAFGTDRRTTGLLDFGDGRQVGFTCSTQSVNHQRLHLYGTKGRIEVTIPFNQPEEDPCTYFMHDGSSVSGIDQTRYDVEVADHYKLEGDWFSTLVQTQQPTGALLDDSVLQARILDALFRSESTGKLETV
jgi:predicted dehydrogenase